MRLTEAKILDLRDEIQSRVNANDRIFDKFMSKIPAKHKAKYEDLEGEFVDFFFNNIFYKPKDVRRFINRLYEREILKRDDEEEL